MTNDSNASEKPNVKLSGARRASAGMLGWAHGRADADVVDAAAVLGVYALGALPGMAGI
jgi:hypothetical protein